MKKRYYTKKRNGNHTLSLVIIVCTIFLWYTVADNPKTNSQENTRVGGNSISYPVERTITPTLRPAIPTPRPAIPTPYLLNTKGDDCDSSYPDICIAPYPPDLDCGEISYRRFRVVGADRHGFDGDGIGCER